MALKIKRQKTRMALRRQRRVLQRSEISLGREGCSQAVNFPEVRNEIVALKKLEQEQKEVALRIAQIEEAVKQIEAQRNENSKQQTAALASLEAEKKPLLQRRDEARAGAQVCERELTVVDAKIEQNDATDRELLKQITAAQAQTPPPEDLAAQMERISAQRVRLPDERAELVRARLGSSEACRAAREKLNAAEAELALAEKNIERVRGQYETTDRELNEKSRAQQEAVRSAREQHQSVEERKNPAYLNIGRHLASKNIAPPSAPQLLTDVQRHRTAVDRHVQHTAELAALSAQVDKQELRKFYFTIASLVVLLAIILPVVFQSPQKREWLPQEAETILALNTEQWERNDLPRKWGQEQGEVWRTVWSGLLGSAAHAPALDVARETRRVTRALKVDESGAARDFVLLEALGDVTRAVRKVAGNQSFERRMVSGLPVWEKPGLTVARVGPHTLALGRFEEVDELVQVRLGMRADLKITGPLFTEFQALENESTVRLISRNPTDLPRVFQPIFAPELLSASELIGLGLDLRNPLKTRLLLHLKSPARAADLAGHLRAEPQRWLRLEGSTLLLYAQPPQITQKDSDIELRFEMPENSARLFLERLAHAEPTASPVVTAR